MGADTSAGEILVRMLIDLLAEADAVRWHDPVRAAHLDEAADDLRAVIAEKRETSQHASD